MRLFLNISGKSRNMNATAIEQLRLISLALLKNTEGFKERDAAGEIREALARNPRIKLVKGFRGLGKTTAMLQVFGTTPGAFYLSADHPLVKETGIYAIAREIVSNGHTTLFIDEVHTHPKWRADIKALHDELPTLRIVASGSAPLALNPERREEVLAVYPMDLGELIFLRQGQRIENAEVWKDKETAMAFMAAHPAIEAEFNRYIRYNAFPASLELDEERALDAIYQSIRKSVREDAVFFLNMSKDKVFGMENLLSFLATSPPGEWSITSLSNDLGLSKTLIYELVETLEAMDIIRVIRPYKKGTLHGRSEPKLLLAHPNLRWALCRQLGKEANLGAIREELAVFSLIRQGWIVNTIKGMKKSPDYVIERGKERYTIEIGGETKGRSQLRGFENGLVLGPYQLIPLAIVAKKSKKG